MFYVYVIKSQLRNCIYVGMTNKFQRRIRQHNSGENSTTKAYGPFELVFGEEYNTRAEAREREKYLKSGVDKEFIKSFLK